MFLVVIRLVAVVFCMLALHADAATQSSEDPLARGPVFPPDHYPIFSTSHQAWHRNCGVRA